MLSLYHDALSRIGTSDRLPDTAFDETMIKFFEIALLLSVESQNSVLFFIAALSGIHEYAT